MGRDDQVGDRPQPGLLFLIGPACSRRRHWTAVRHPASLLRQARPRSGVSMRCTGLKGLWRWHTMTGRVSCARAAGGQSGDGLLALPGRQRSEARALCAEVAQW